MAEEARVKVIGYDELIDGSRKLAEQIGEQAERDFEQVAQDRGETAAARMPRRTGRMAGAVQARRIQARGGGEAATVGISRAAVPYAGFVEFGGIRNRPYVPSGRYLFPVATEAEAELVIAGTKAAHEEIRGQRWPIPKG